MYCSRGGREVCCHVVLEAVLADVVQKLLEIGNLHDSDASEGIQRVVRERAFFHGPADCACGIVRRETREAHGTWLDSSDDCSEGVFLAYCARDDFLEVHADILEEVLGKIAAVEADGLVGIVTVVVVPIQQGAGTF